MRHVEDRLSQHVSETPISVSNCIKSNSPPIRCFFCLGNWLWKHCFSCAQCRQWSAGTPISYSGFNWPRVFTRENIWHAAGKAGLFLFTFYHVCFLWKCIITLISLNGHCFSKTLSLKVHRHKKPAESYNEEDRACQVHLHYWYK